MSGLYRVWKEFKHLHDQLNGINKNTRVRYSPTIDYVNDIPDGDLQPLIDAFRSEMLLIAREEIAFVKEHGYHLMTWFAAGDSKQHCTAGEHMQVIDVDGQVYTCHGSLYSPNKEDMTSGSIEDDSFVENIAAATDKYHQHTRELSPICTGCVATTCMVCPVASYDKSTHETFEDRWTDRWVGNLCGFFKTFGEIDRTVQSHLQGVLSTSTTGDN
jgi:radical SAM protein with 4Fe4S-binding SPASM domain